MEEDDGDDESDREWNEMSYLDDEDMDYDDPFEAFDAVAELKATLESIEQHSPEYFIRIIGELSTAEKKQLQDGFVFLAADASK